MRPVSTPYLFLITILPLINLHAQHTDVAYQDAIKARAYRITAPLKIEDSAQFYRVRDLIAGEYIAIKRIDDKKEAAINRVKNKGLSAEAGEAEKKLITDQAETERNLLNEKFIGLLSTEISKEQIEQVKNGMTYNVLPITYKGYQEMIPRLSNEEKKYIYDALSEAREHAMAAGSSEAKHGWFGKYKGRINNYLSSRGYDMNKESKAWQERIKQEQKK